MSIIPRGGTKGLERSACSKYYSVGKTLPKIHIASKKGKNLSSPVAPLLWQIDRYARELFCVKFNFEPLYWKRFLIRCVFLAMLSPTLNVI